MIREVSCFVRVCVCVCESLSVSLRLYVYVYDYVDYDGDADAHTTIYMYTVSSITTHHAAYSSTARNTYYIRPPAFDTQFSATTRTKLPRQRRDLSPRSAVLHLPCWFTTRLTSRRFSRRWLVQILASNLNTNTPQGTCVLVSAICHSKC